MTIKLPPSDDGHDPDIQEAGGHGPRLDPPACGDVDGVAVRQVGWTEDDAVVRCLANSTMSHTTSAQTNMATRANDHRRRKRSSVAIRGSLPCHATRHARVTSRSTAARHLLNGEGAFGLDCPSEKEPHLPHAADDPASRILPGHAIGTP